MCVLISTSNVMSPTISQFQFLASNVMLLQSVIQNKVLTSPTILTIDETKIADFKIGPI